MPKHITILRPAGDPLRYQLRETEPLTTLQIEFQEAIGGGRAKQLITLDAEGNERVILLNGRQILGIVLETS